MVCLIQGTRGHDHCTPRLPVRPDVSGEDDWKVREDEVREVRRIRREQGRESLGEKRIDCWEQGLVSWGYARVPLLDVGAEDERDEVVQLGMERGEVLCRGREERRKRKAGRGR